MKIHAQLAKDGKWQIGPNDLEATCHMDIKIIHIRIHFLRGCGMNQNTAGWNSGFVEKLKYQEQKQGERENA